MTDWIYRADFVGLDATGASTTFRYASKAYVTSPSHPTLANTFFDGRLVQALLLEADMYGSMRTYGDLEIPHGTVVLSNADGALDSLIAYGFDIQKIKIYRIDPAAIDTENIIFYGLMEQAVLDADTFTITVRDYTYKWDRALQPTKFAGNNSLPNGLEGGADDIAGSPKPVCYGTVYNIEPVQVNTSRLIYQFHDDSIFGGSINAVYDSRVALTAGVSRIAAEMQAGATLATVSSIDTTTDTITFTAAHPFSTTDIVHVDAATTMPAPLLNTQYYYARNTGSTTITLHPTSNDALLGTNKVNLTTTGAGTITVAKNRTAYGRYDFGFYAIPNTPSGSFIRLGSTPTGRVTMDVTSLDTTYTTDLWRDVFKKFLAHFGSGIALNFEDMLTSSAAAVHVGFYFRDEINLYDALRQVAGAGNASLQVYPYTTSTNVALVLRRLESPASPSRLDLDQTCIVPGSFKKLQTQDTERGIPPYRINVNFKKSYTVMLPAEIAASARADMFPNTEWRTVNADTTAVQLKYPGAPEATFDCYLKSSTDATTHAGYLSGLYSSVTRGLYGLSIPMDLIDSLTYVGVSGTIPGLMQGDVVKVTFPRFQFDSGVYMAVIGYTLDHQKRTVDLIVWG